MAVDHLVDSYVPYVARPIIAHAYAGPFAVLYAVWIYLWFAVYGVNEYWELGCIGLAAIGLLQVLCSHCIFKEPNAENATVVKVVPTPNNGWPEVVPLQRMKLVNGSTKLWFEFQKVHYTFDFERKTFVALELDTNQPMSFFQESRGLETDEVIMERRQILGDNRMEMFIPQFMELFKERATAPFFVFQVEFTLSPSTLHLSFDSLHFVKVHMVVTFFLVSGFCLQLFHQFTSTLHRFLFHCMVF
ncbi:unnamed protein product [Gongylonema pulchrum]|uniref:PIG-H domain-containing protein n=1 Tax=Gongylonema pulchrum TaxID=637853 RepID=A0A183DZI6_9BILA|nr:unnamed protein product [Gongylonema pulchrum]